MNRKIKQRKRMLTLLLAGIVMFSSLPVNVLAEQKQAADGICSHHTAHSYDVCGYREAVAGKECRHEHSEGCYRITEQCIHEHTDGCYGQEDVSGGISGNGTSEEGAEREPSGCTHVCSAESGCIKKELDCPHERGEHTEECGYAEGIPGQPCSYVCEICGDAETGGSSEMEGTESIEGTESAEGTESTEETDPVEWPEAPGQIEGPPELGEGERLDGFYGRPMSLMSAKELQELQKLSAQAAVEQNPDKEIKLDEISTIAFIYVNGEAYTGGDLEVTEGDNFSYLLGWSPNLDSDNIDWEDGSWFETTMFQVPGLNLASASNIQLSINGIKVGEYFLSYDRKTGEMTYKVIFNRYIQFFDASTVLAEVQGSGRFVDILTDADISEGEDSGKLTVAPRPEIPTVPTIPGGTGWKPSQPPKFEDTTYPFGKGVKWTSGTDAARVPQIEWRVVFLEQLQKTQREFLKNPDQVQPESEGYVIITDTLDVNQAFYAPPEDASRYGDAPFYLELPVIIPGTGTILNGTYNVGNGNYDGPGEIHSLYKGDQFVKIDGSGANTADEIRAVQKNVRETPLTWTVTTDPATRQQTLLINAGKLGTNDPTKGVTWSESNNRDWPIKNLEKKIQECNTKIEEGEEGYDSPIAQLNGRYTTLLNLLERAVVLPENAGQKEELLQGIDNWKRDYTAWFNDKRVGFLLPLDKQNEAGDWELFRPLPNEDLAERLEECHVNSSGRQIKHTEEYQDYLKALENIQEDQRIYLNNRLEYGKSWEQARGYYERALDFYEKHDGVYGFVVKVRTKSINTSMKDYSNKVNIELGDKSWFADDDADVHFAGGIIGSYNVGDVVLQKADAFYDTGADEEDILKVEKDKAGLEGAVFRMYCGEDDTGTSPELTEKNLAHFLDKDASVNGTTYRYTHTGTEHTGAFEGDIEDLLVEADGKLALSHVVPVHDHWIVEQKAPEGYYLDKEPIRISSDTSKVSYQLVPNHSRSVMLRKINSFSGQPVEGAEFGLWKIESGRKTPVTDFKVENLNGHETYWKGGGSETLKTNADGELCIHGLEAGSYVLQETAPAPGYVMPDQTPEYFFELKEELPEQTGQYDEDYHLLLTPENPLENDPGVATLTMDKKGVGDESMEGTGFALFRFTGTEAEWEENPDAEDLWETAAFNGDSGYFKTKNQIGTVGLTDENAADGWLAGGKIPMVLTDETNRFTVTDIPLGHYSVAEVKVPNAAYQRDYRSFYFTVDKDTVGKGVQLYTEPEEKNALTGNVLKNYKKLAQLALVKHDAAKAEPVPEGEPFTDGAGYQYTEPVLKEGSPEGLAGAVYKLFMRRGASAVFNPYPKELENPDRIVGYQAGYDTCVALGTTGEDGVLKLEDMKGPNGKTIRGLNPEEYYMIEVKAPDGYLLDQTAILFSLNEEVFEEDEDEPGRVMVVSNSRADYGIRLTKADASSVGEGKIPLGLPGARFEVKQGNELLYFTGTDGTYRKTGKDTEGAVPYVVTGKDGNLTVTGLSQKTTYLFLETKAPQGYQKSESPVEITTPEGTQDGMLEDGILFPKEHTYITNERLLGKVTLHKQVAETAEALPGVEFTLYETIVSVIQPGEPGYDSTNPDATRSEDVEIMRGTTDEQGNLTFEGLPWSDSYYIMETKAPDGYMLDQAKRRFSIDESWFDENGQAIPVQFPFVVNRKGVLGKALLYKADADNLDKGLEDAHFYLEKYMGTDAVGKEYWVGYGQGMYKTDADGEIRFLLPPGNYRLSEMKAPDGYLMEGMKQLHFTIEETADGMEPEAVIIDEDGSTDGAVTNKKGECGLYFKKTLAGTEIPVPGVTFRIYWHFESDDSNQPVVEKDVYFIDNGDGYYEYIDDSNAPGAVKNLVTGDKGEFYAILPKGFLKKLPALPGYSEPVLMYEETDAPEGIARPLRKGVIDELKDNIYEEIFVENTLKEEILNDLSISVNKKDGKSRLGLEGAEFELFAIMDLGSEKLELKLANGVTDKKGHLRFDKDTQGNPLILTPGSTYYVRETKAPDGYVRDETVHEITLDERHFDGEFHFIPVELSLENDKIRGLVHLKKVSASDTSKGLSGAEFELLRKKTDAGSMDEQWEHYGAERYITDENGELFIGDLPYGSYELVERTAPLGYLLGNPAPAFTFVIEENHQKVELGEVENEADPNPVRDVYVKKVAAENPDQGLSGAEFELYELKEDGNYHLRQQRIYVTDSKGEFVIGQLPVGSYALKERKAPAGYDVPEQDMTYFTVRVEDRSVTLQIENARSKDTGEGGNEGGDQDGNEDGNGGGQNDGDSGYSVSVTAEKVWEDGGSAARPDSVFVQLYRNGIAYGNPVKLSAENNWKHVWSLLDGNAGWFVDEVGTADGYEKIVSHKGNRWTITNRAKLPASAGILPDTGQDSPKTAGSGGWTGDDSPLLLWIGLLGISAAGICAVLAGTAMRRKKKKPKKGSGKNRNRQVRHRRNKKSLK